MTELDRILSKGVLPADFLRPEERSGFPVDVQRKKIWAVELDLLLEIDRVCRKNNIRYWLCAGTLLGAVRHGGFIPWDDDLDIIMMREDFDRFVRLGAEFKSPYFLQTHDTDPEYFYSFPKIRNSNTTSLSEMFAYQDMNHGIFVDLYPLDPTDAVKGPEVFAEIDRLNRELSTYMRMKKPDLNAANRERVAGYCGESPDALYRRIQELAVSVPDDGTGRIVQFLSTMTGYRRNCFHAADFATTRTVRFEGFDFPAPGGTDGLLTDTFGDYMRLPPPEQRTGHFGSLFEPDVPYCEFLKKYRKAGEIQ